MEPFLGMRIMGASLKGQTIQGNLAESKGRTETAQFLGFKTESNETGKQTSMYWKEYSRELKNQS